MLTVWAARSLWRRLLCLLTRQKPRVEGHCLQCGSCCREIALCDSGHWVRTRRHFRQLMEKQPGYERLNMVGRDTDGRILFRCSWLAPDGRCRCYRDRLPLCRNHPSPSLWLRGVDLPDSCGYTLTGPTLSGLLRRKTPTWDNPPDQFNDVLQQERKSRAKSDGNGTEGAVEAEKDP
ncbi:hypothetical protein SAMN02745704_01858 [Paucidesulfovibrio gracilis DSM 16080]|uniref:Uncharacterized protein n=1 Tax=Paucidesulfovibrio gracilis DSM 16080 TaxID=1121449 RepID=A0A1T4X6V7_9BACT|nr:hypothetical protein [Paucidesulfovibrio gracilis]SKA85410.1 hypothetical protein SAMN02745704_01858 [Paucidesulfovibrio gracilis DSM 16080]